MKTSFFAILVALTMLGLFTTVNAAEPNCWQKNWNSGKSTAKMVQLCGKDSRKESLCYSYCTEVRNGNRDNCASICGVSDIGSRGGGRRRSPEEDEAFRDAVRRARENNCLMRPLCINP